jgi:hypothetical protein
MPKKKSVRMRACETKESVLEDNGCVMVSPQDFKWDEDFTYTFDPSPFKRSEIDQIASKNVQVRVSQKLDEPTVNRYSNGIRKGDVFPAIVLFKDESLSSEPVKGDGNHTDAACDHNNVEVIEGVYKFAHPDAHEIAGIFNSRTTGLSENAEDVLEKAVRQYYGAKDRAEENGTRLPKKSESAEKYRIAPEAFNRQCRIKDVKEILASKGVKVDNIQHDGSFDVISKICKIDEQAAVKIGRMAVKFALPTKEVRKVSNSYLDGSKGSAAKATYLEKVEESYKRSTSNGTQNGGGKRSSKRSPEIILKESLVKCAKMSDRIEEKKFKKMMADDMMSESVDLLSKLFRRLK